MTDDRFFEHLRADAVALRHEPDDRTLSRLRARIRESIERPATVAELLAAWFRPLAATLAAVAIAAAIGAAALAPSEETALGESPVVVSMAGDAYRVPN
jgi:hypothetical protein